MFPGSILLITDAKVEIEYDKKENEWYFGSLMEDQKISTVRKSTESYKHKTRTENREKGQKTHWPWMSKKSSGGGSPEGNEDIDSSKER